MAGIYIHIPFCKKICYYCDFYKSANYRYVTDFMIALQKEIILKSNFTDEKITTIYFGGGTPSSVSLTHIETILQALYRNFSIIEAAEITFEINPDDVDFAYLKALRSLGINRLSIGIQSFNETILQFLNRRHTARQSVQVIKDAKNAGFNNISIDLIYGIPNQQINDFIHDLELFRSFQLSHLSAYHLTIEEKTQFGRMLKKGTLSEVKETKSLNFYNQLINFMRAGNYEHYEISNFALTNCYSEHNMSYWKNIPYIGLGPSAHSYNGNSRFWNTSSVKAYIENITKNKAYFEQETLNETDKFNEYIITGLRTKWGCNLAYIKANFGEKQSKFCLNILEDNKNSYFFNIDNQQFALSEKALLQSDFYIEKFIIEK